MNVEDMTRTELENALMIQCGQLKTQRMQIENLKKSYEILEKEYDIVATQALMERQWDLLQQQETGMALGELVIMQGAYTTTNL